MPASKVHRSVHRRGLVGASNFPRNPGYDLTSTIGPLAYRAADGIINHYLDSPGMIG